MTEYDHSFAILAYKESPYLEECILSLKRQTIKSEIFISTSTPSGFLDRIAGKYNLRIVINKESKGIGSDWSFAYKRANTKYVTLAHQDDIYLPEYARLCISNGEKYGDSLIIFTDYFELSEIGLVAINLNLSIKRLILASFYLRKKCLFNKKLKRLMLSFGQPIPCPGITYNKSNIGAFQFSKELKLNLDWDALLRLAEQKGGFIYVNRKLFHHRIHEEAETSIGISNQDRRREDEFMFKQLLPPFLWEIISKLYTNSYRSNLIINHEEK